MFYFVLLDSHLFSIIPQTNLKQSNTPWALCNVDSILTFLKRYWTSTRWQGFSNQCSQPLQEFQTSWYFTTSNTGKFNSLVTMIMAECLNATKATFNLFQNVQFGGKKLMLSIIKYRYSNIKDRTTFFMKKSCETPTVWETSIYGSPLNNVLTYLSYANPLTSWPQEGNPVD